MNDQITGIFLSFDNGELEHIQRKLELFGYEKNGEGLKEFIIDTFESMEQAPEPDRTGNVISQLSDFIQQNPEGLVNGIKMAGKIKDFLLKKRK